MKEASHLAKKRGPETEKEVLLRMGLNPCTAELVNHCLSTWF